MGLLNLHKLEKLKIEAYTDEDRKKPLVPPSMTVMFNPTSYKREHALTFTSPQSIGSAGRPAGYSFSPPGKMSFTFVLDGTGVTQVGVLEGESVKDQIKKFDDLCLKMNGDIHEPNFLKIIWGSNLSFSARLQALDITYQLFDEGGDPLRAELHATFVDDRSVKAIALEAGKNSPDLAHVRTVRSGDTLPLLCKEIYGASDHYLRVARDNGLDDFRNLIPGQKLYFAPLDAGAAAGGGATK